MCTIFLPSFNTYLILFQFNCSFIRKVEHMKVLENTNRQY